MDTPDKSLDVEENSKSGIGHFTAAKSANEIGSGCRSSDACCQPDESSANACRSVTAGAETLSEANLEGINNKHSDNTEKLDGCRLNHFSMDSLQKSESIEDASQLNIEMKTYREILEAKKKDVTGKFLACAEELRRLKLTQNSPGALLMLAAEANKSQDSVKNKSELELSWFDQILDDYISLPLSTEYYGIRNELAENEDQLNKNGSYVNIGKSVTEGKSELKKRDSKLKQKQENEELFPNMDYACYYGSIDEPLQEYYSYDSCWNYNSKHSESCNKCQGMCRPYNRVVKKEMVSPLLNVIQDQVVDCNLYAQMGLPDDFISEKHGFMVNDILLGDLLEQSKHVSSPPEEATDKYCNLGNESQEAPKDNSTFTFGRCPSGDYEAEAKAKDDDFMNEEVLTHHYESLLHIDCEENKAGHNEDCFENLCGNHAGQNFKRAKLSDYAEGAWVPNRPLSQLKGMGDEMKQLICYEHIQCEIDSSFNYQSEDEHHEDPRDSLAVQAGLQPVHELEQDQMDVSSEFVDLPLEPSEEEFKDELMDDSESENDLDSFREIQKDSNQKKSPLCGRKRDKYKMISEDIKEKAVELANKRGSKYAATFFSVPLKSLKRWLRVGCQRKKGGGRKTKDPLMEKNLYQWYRQMKSENEFITAKMIKEKAIQLTTCPDFIASKGWLDKFKIRFNLEISKESTRGSRKVQVSKPAPEKKRVESIPFNITHIENEAGSRSCRRSLIKSATIETHDNVNSCLNEGAGRVVGGKKSKAHTTSQKKMSDTSLKVIINRKSGCAKAERCHKKLSACASSPSESQFRNSKRIDESCSNVISLPVHN